MSVKIGGSTTILQYHFIQFLEISKEQTLLSLNLGTKWFFLWNIYKNKKMYLYWTSQFQCKRNGGSPLSTTYWGKNFNFNVISSLKWVMCVEISWVGNSTFDIFVKFERVVIIRIGVCCNLCFNILAKFNEIVFRKISDSNR